MRKHLFAVVLAVVAVGVCALALARQEKPAPPKDQTDRDAALKTELTDADRAFAKAAAEKGIDGWMSFMADDAVRVSPLGGKARVGKAAVKELDAAMFADPKRKLVWEPTDAGAFADGKHGWTTGRFKMLARNDKGEEEVLRTGAYVTWWRKGADGRWKVILDTGAPDPPKK